MFALAAVFAFAGYTLVYSAVANGGRFALTPWESLRRDAYTDGGSLGAVGGAPHQHKSTFDTILGWALKLSPFGGGLGGLLP